MGLITVNATEAHRSRLPEVKPFLHVWIGRSGEDSGEKIIVRILRRYGLTLRAKDIRYGRYGKPEIGRTEFPCFNMTNDAGIFLFAVTDYGEIGVDLQGPIDQNQRKEALEAVFAPEEMRAMSRNSFCYPASVYWAAKEALVKQEGSSIWFGDTLRIVDRIDKRSEGRWVHLENRWIYAVERKARGFALALSGEGRPPDPEFLIGSSER